MESSVTRPDNTHCDSQESNRATTVPERDESTSLRLLVPDLMVQRVRERILSRASKHLLSLDILVHSSFVEATGMANSYYAKQLVTHALLDGMPDVEIRNSLGVRPLPLLSPED